MMDVANTAGRAMYVTDATYKGNPSELIIMARPGPMRSTTAGAMRAATAAVKYNCAQHVQRLHESNAAQQLSVSVSMIVTNNTTATQRALNPAHS